MEEDHGAHWKIAVGWAVIATAVTSLAETNLQTFLPPFPVLFACAVCAGLHGRSLVDGVLMSLAYLAIAAGFDIHRGIKMWAFLYGYAFTSLYDLLAGLLGGLVGAYLSGLFRKPSMW